MVFQASDLAAHLEAMKTGRFVLRDECLNSENIPRRSVALAAIRGSTAFETISSLTPCGGTCSSLAGMGEGGASS